MSAIGDSIRDRIARRDSFRLAEIMAFMGVEDDLDVWSAVYEALSRSYDRIRPEPGMELTCSFMLKYLLRCIRENQRSSEDVHSGFEAAWDLAACLKHWSKRLPETDGILRLAEQQMREVYLSGDEQLRNRLETGTLEHALEEPRVRPYFAGWANDPTLREAWEPAMEWGQRHSERANQ